MHKLYSQKKSVIHVTFENCFLKTAGVKRLPYCSEPLVH